jgi:hypothetical protein
MISLTPATTNPAKPFEAFLVLVLSPFFVNSLGYFFYLLSDLSVAALSQVVHAFAQQSQVPECPSKTG